MNPSGVSLNFDPFENWPRVSFFNVPTDTFAAEILYEYGLWFNVNDLFNFWTQLSCT